VRAAALALVGVLGACVPDNGPLMRPGEDCIACHGGIGALPPGERRRHGKTWTVAGTVFEDPDAGVGAEGVEVQITDRNGWSFSLRANEAGNFYSREEVALPLQTCLSRGSSIRCMQGAVAFPASCNSCHGLDVAAAPLPPLTAP